MRPGPGWFILIETIGIISFAINAMMVAERKGLSTLGIFLCAVATSFGGGTLRDVLLGPSAQPFFWVAYPFYIVSVFALSIAYANTITVRAVVAKRDFVIKETAEAIALASLGSLGAVKAFNILGPSIGSGFWATSQLWILCAFFGAVSAAFGSIIRDMVINEFPGSLKPGVWVLESVFIGSGVIATLRMMDVPQAWALLFGFAVTLAIRLHVVMKARA